jgi:hypothetical protein
LAALVSGSAKSLITPLAGGEHLPAHRVYASPSPVVLQAQVAYLSLFGKIAAAA